MTKALDGVHVLDMTQFEAGPAAAQQLAWLGADVIKIERPQIGEVNRGRNKKSGPDHKDGISFLIMNTNKRSVTINLGSPKGKEMFTGMIKKADVLTENFGPGSLERLGFGPDEILKINPRMIIGRIKGFPTGSPYEQFRTFDSIAQSTGGLVSTTGESMDRNPVKPGGGIGDTGTGMLLAAGVCAALFQREKTGRGQVVEVAMQESVINVMRLRYSPTVTRGIPAERTGTEGSQGNYPCGLFPTKGGGPNDWVWIYGSRREDLNNENWYALLTAMGRKDMIGDPRFDTPGPRMENGELVEKAVSDWTSQHDKKDIMTTLGAVNVPVGAVYDTVDLYNDPFLNKHGMYPEVNHPIWGKVKVVGSPIRLSDSVYETKAAPLLGQDNYDVYKEFLNYSQAEVDALREQGVV